MTREQLLPILSEHVRMRECVWVSQGRFLALPPTPPPSRSLLFSTLFQFILSDSSNVMQFVRVRVLQTQTDEDAQAEYSVVIVKASVWSDL